jgi:hypothetical protein
MSEIKKHAKLSASGSSKWINCPGSIEAESKVVKNQSVYAEEGTLAHELADMCLKQKVDASTFIGKTIFVKSDGKTLSTVVDKEMAKFVQEYLDYVLSFETKNSQLYTEDKVDFSNIAPGGFGTLDSAILDYDSGVCHIFDLKYGQGVEVSAIENTQGQLYALGFYNELKCLDVIKSFVIHIVQPRKWNFSKWEISIKDLIAFGEFAKTKAKEALTPGAKRVPGYKQCEFCSAKASCTALDKFTQEVISADFDNLDNVDSDVITNERVKLILDNKKLIESFLNAVENKTFERLLKGEKIPGYKIVEGKSNRKWIDDAEARLIEKLGDEAFEKSLIGITAAEKKLNKKEVNDLTYKPPGKLTMAPESDKRPAVTSIIDDFINLNDTDYENEM